MPAETIEPLHSLCFSYNRIGYETRVEKPHQDNAFNLLNAETRIGWFAIDRANEAPM